MKFLVNFTLTAEAGAKIEGRPGGLSVAGEERLRVAWTLCVVSHQDWKSVPIPVDLRARLQAFLPPAA